MPAAASAPTAAAAAGATPTASEARGPANDSLRLSYYACTAPESRFLRHFFGAVSLVRDVKGLYDLLLLLYLFLLLLLIWLLDFLLLLLHVFLTHVNTPSPNSIEHDGDAAVICSSTPASIDLLLQPLQQIEPTAAADSAALLALGASVLDCLGNVRWPYTPFPSLAESLHPYFAAAKVTTSLH